jgi:hypothetical protein
MMVVAGLTSLALGAGGCVWPAPVELESADGGPGSPPVIISSGPAPEFALPGPLVLDRSDNPLLSLTVRDNDIDEELFVRLYVDYGIDGEQRPARSGCVIPPSGAIERVGQCAVTPVCGDIEDDDESEHLLEAMIADRRFLEETDRPPEQPPHRGLPADAAYSIRAWIMRCLPAEPL